MVLIEVVLLVFLFEGLFLYICFGNFMDTQILFDNYIYVQYIGVNIDASFYVLQQFFIQKWSTQTFNNHIFSVSAQETCAVIVL